MEKLPFKLNLLNFGFNLITLRFMITLFNNLHLNKLISIKIKLICVNMNAVHLNEHLLLQTF